MHRFFVAAELLANLAPARGARIMLSLPKAIAHQVRDVLHLAVGEQLLLLDNSGDEVLATVIQSSHAGVDVQLLERRVGKSESPVRIILCQGLLKSARFEWILEKGTELGVAVFAPILCRRSMAGLEDAGLAKMQRWQRIIQEAAEQCGRSRLPELLPIRPLMHALNDIPAGALAIMPWEEEHTRSLREALSIGLQHDSIGELPTPDERSDVVGALSEARFNSFAPWGGVGHTPDTSFPHSPASSTMEANQAIAQSKTAESIPNQPITVVLFIGPEGGLTAEEVVLTQRHGVQVVTLGPRILRAETAALAAVANVMYELMG